MNTATVIYLPFCGPPNSAFPKKLTFLRIINTVTAKMAIRQYALTLKPMCFGAIESDLPCKEKNQNLQYSKSTDAPRRQY